MNNRQENPLQHAYTFWYSTRASGKPSSAQPYDQQLQQVNTFDSVEGFWRVYSHMRRPSELQGHYDIHLFKTGIKPMWEDEKNSEGGKWVLRVKKGGLADRIWELISVFLVSNSIPSFLQDEICGCVVSIRYNEDIISLWNRTASDQLMVTKIRDTFRRVCNLPQDTIINYVKHADSLRHSAGHRPAPLF